MEQRGWDVFGGTVAAATTFEKGVFIFRVIKVKLSFGELHMSASDFNIINSASDSDITYMCASDSDIK